LNHRNIGLLAALISSLFVFASTCADAASWTGAASYYAARTPMGCAHRFLPFGTKLKVTNLRNGHELILTVNDRGPFIKGRIVDVSTHAAELLGFRRAGVVPVQIETLSNETVMN
jgi:rare lipoprotein A